MGSLFSFSLLSSALMAAMLIPYKVFLSREKQPGLNRAILLMIYGLSMLGATWLLVHPVHLVEFFDFSKIEPSDVMTILKGGEVVGASPVDESPLPDRSWLDIAHIITILYFLGGAVITTITLVSLIRLCQIVLKARPARIFGKEIRVYSDRKLPPFSVMKTIIISNCDQGSEMEMIMAHEAAHIRRCHWIDLVVARCVVILQWYNPAAWLMMRELRAVHEYQADSDTISGGASPKEYQLMLIGMATNHSISGFASSLNNSNLKKRIIMMNSKTTGAGRRMRVLAFLPFLAAAVCAASTNSVQNLLKEISSPAPQETPAAIMVAPVSIESVAVESTPVAAVAPEEKVATTADVLPSYPGGESAMMGKLVKLLKYPPTAIKDSVEGRVVVKFVVGKDGTTSKYQVTRSIRKDLDEAAVEAVKALGNFKPAKNKGAAVACYFTLPITFRLNGNYPEKK